MSLSLYKLSDYIFYYDTYKHLHLQSLNIYTFKYKQDGSHNLRVVMPIPTIIEGWTYQNSLNLCDDQPWSSFEINMDGFYELIQHWEYINPHTSQIHAIAHLNKIKSLKHLHECIKCMPKIFFNIGILQHPMGCFLLYMYLQLFEKKCLKNEKIVIQVHTCISFFKLFIVWCIGPVF